MSISLHSPNLIAALLNIKIHSWSQETGFPVCIRVRIAHRTFNLHKLPLTRKSGYMREKLKDRDEVELPPDFPGGPDTFEIMALFIYAPSSSSAAALVNPSNVAALRCAAAFLKMTEAYEALDVYLNRVVLQSWKDTVTVLHTCQALLPWAEDVLMVSRCIETLAFMACMEILDPERNGDGDGDEEGAWPWIEDVVALPLPFFKRVIASLRRQGMKDKYVSPIIISYAHKWVLSKYECECQTTHHYLQGVIELVAEGKGCRAIPVGFYLSLLAASIEVDLRNESVERLQNQIALMLHLAQPQDLLLPKDGIKLCVMEKIFMNSDTNNPAVAQLWDIYLNQIAADPDLPCNRFIALIQALPTSTRDTHDQLYGALNAFFHSHPNLSHQEKGLVCQYIDCHKLSPRVCIEAVRNEVMPLRLMVQALLVHQLNTQQACTDYSGSLSTPHKHKDGSDSSPSPCCELLSRKDYESTSFRIESLEKELMSLKKTLELQQISNRKNHQNKLVEGNKNDNQVTSCIASVNFASQRKYANRILKMLQRLTLFRSKKKTAAHHHL